MSTHSVSPLISYFAQYVLGKVRLEILIKNYYLLFLTCFYCYVYRGSRFNYTSFWALFYIITLVLNCFLASVWVHKNIKNTNY